MATPLNPPIERVSLGTTKTHRPEAEVAKAMANSINALQGHGLMLTVSEEEAEQARQAFLGETKLRDTPPAAVAKLGLLLSEYDHQIVRHADQIRTFVTNRLIEESSDKNPQIRIKALELLGKIGDVGLFTDKTEITVHSQATNTIEAKLRSKLQTLMDVTDAEIIPNDAPTRGAPVVEDLNELTDPMVLLRDLE